MSGLNKWEHIMNQARTASERSRTKDNKTLAQALYDLAESQDNQTACDLMEAAERLTMRAITTKDIGRN